MPPEQEPIEDPYAPTAWGDRADSDLVDLEMPSHQRALLRRPGVLGLVKAGVLASIDSLTALVDRKYLQSGTKVTPETLKALADDEGAINRLIETIDKVLLHVVVRPKLYAVPVEDETGNVPARVIGNVYVDSIDVNDKMFIFNFVVGGTRDWETFLRQSAQSLGALEAVQRMEGEAKPDPGDKGSSRRMVLRPGNPDVRDEPRRRAPRSRQQGKEQVRSRGKAGSSSG